MTRKVCSPFVWIGKFSLKLQNDADFTFFFTCITYTSCRNHSMWITHESSIVLIFCCDWYSIMWMRSTQQLILTRFKTRRRVSWNAPIFFNNHMKTLWFYLPYKYSLHFIYLVLNCIFLKPIKERLKGLNYCLLLPTFEVFFFWIFLLFLSWIA